MQRKQNREMIQRFKKIKTKQNTSNFYERWSMEKRSVQWSQIQIQHECSLDAEEHTHRNTHHCWTKQGRKGKFHFESWSLTEAPSYPRPVPPAPGDLLLQLRAWCSKPDFPWAEQFKTILVTQIEGESIFQANYWTEVEFIKPITPRRYGKGGGM